MRLLLITGKGGVGKTTLAAATAALAARRGRKTLVLSTDGAHSLADAFGLAAGWNAGSEAHEIEPGLWVEQLDTRGRFERSWGRVQDYLLTVLDAAGVDPIYAAELSVVPGAEEVLALLELLDRANSGRYDLIVIDCAPTAETLRLLALPDILRWYVDRLLPADRRVLRAIRPVLGRSSGLPMPKDAVFAAIEALHGDLAVVRSVLSGPGASVRLVLTPEALVLAEARRTLTSLALYGYRVDGVVANRVFPAVGGEAGRGARQSWQAGWARAQARCLVEVEESFAPLPVRRAAYLPAEPVGVDALVELAEGLYGPQDPAADPGPDELLRVERSAGEFVLSLALPLADRGDVDLARSGDELVLTVGPHRRIVALPSGLRRCTVEGAALRDGRLRIRFAPDPALWRAL